ncbi:four helix bundle protein [Desulfohalobium retbaense]|uniref:four helix bundle protein n=1 Tax=Desulfohalobium retbaense TaxID=45663 RepID=UPI002445AEB0|nr:four helix bundle protein [Desulfohalobium retbaense]
MYQKSFELGMEVFTYSKQFPKEERYSLTDQIRRSSRSVSANIAEAFRSRRYPKAFVAKLGQAECEAAETQVWLDYAFACKYMDEQIHKTMYQAYDQVLGMLISMIMNPGDWSFSNEQLKSEGWP